MPSLPKFSQWGAYLALGNRPARAWFLVLLVAGLLGALSFVYWHPVSHSGVFLNDSFVFFDGIHRLASGQVPHLDFSTPVGALAYWLPYVGSTVVGGYAGAVEVASLILAGIVVPLAAILLWQRVSPAMALLVLGTIAGVIVVPLVPGWPPQEPSHAMQYNRWSWGIILALFLLGLPTAEGKKTWRIRGAIAAVLLASLFFIKITYFAIGSTYLLLLLTYEDARRWQAALAIFGAAVIMLVSLMFTGGMIFAYLSDIAQALVADTAVRGSYLAIALINRHSLVLLIVAVYAGILKANLKWQDLLVVCFVGASGLAIIDQNFQFTFIVTLPAAFALLAAPRSNETDAARLGNSVIVLTCAAMLLPFAADWARVSIKHVTGFSGKEYATLDVPGFENFHVYDRRKIIPSDEPIHFGTVDPTAYLKGEIPVAYLNQRDYMPVLADGVRLLESAGAADSTIFTLEFTNIMPQLVDAPRAPYGYSWIHMGRNVSQETLPAAEKMFAGVDYVIAPLQTHTPIVDQFLEAYGDYFLTHLTEVAQSKHWILFRHRRNQN